MNRVLAEAFREDKPRVYWKNGSWWVDVPKGNVLYRLRGSCWDMCIEIALGRALFA